MQSVTVTFAFVFFVYLLFDFLLDVSGDGLSWALFLYLLLFSILSKDWCSLKSILYSFDFTSSESKQWELWELLAKRGGLWNV